MHWAGRMSEKWERHLLVWMIVYCALFFTALFGLIAFVQWVYP